MTNSTKINWNENYLRAEKRKISYLKSHSIHERKQHFLQLKELKTNLNIGKTKYDAEDYQHLKIEMGY